jgi:predicted nucleotidyltransferase
MLGALNLICVIKNNRRLLSRLLSRRLGDGAVIDNVLYMRAIKQQTPQIKVTTEDPDLNDRFNRVLGDTVEAMEDSGIRYVFIGGIASGGLGRPRSTHDIDIFVMPEDAELVLRALAKKGFRVEKTDPSWLYKGFKEDILVDVIFKSKGEIYLDPEMYARVTIAEFHGRKLRLVAPEDLLIIKAAAHSELTPGHWHDAIALMTHANLDWDYLLKRARRAPRRTLSLLVYAQSVDVFVPNSVIHQLYSSIFNNDGNHRVGLGMQPTQPHVMAHSAPTPRKAPELERTYGVGHLREWLAQDPRTNELDIQIEEAGEKILLRGEVQYEERRKAIETVAKECFPKAVIENQIRVQVITHPSEAEEIP